MMYLSEINLSQLPDLWQTNVTYQNDLMYEHIPNKFTSTDCRDYLTRKIKDLDKKIARNKDSMVTRGWQNKREMYQAILNYLNLYKIK